MEDIIDPGSATWRVVKAHAQRRLQGLRVNLEVEGKDHVESEAIRARIGELKHLLSLVEPQPDIPASSVDNSAGY